MSAVLQDCGIVFLEIIHAHMDFFGRFPIEFTGYFNELRVIFVEPLFDEVIKSHAGSEAFAVTRLRSYGKPPADLGDSEHSDTEAAYDRTPITESPIQGPLLAIANATFHQFLKFVTGKSIAIVLD